MLSSKPALAQIAILYNRLSYMVGGSQPSLSKLGNAERDSLLGLYRAFLEAHMPIDFVDAQDVANSKLGQYKIVFLPFPVMLSKDVAEGLKRYIQNGGVAVAEARLAWNDERGFASAVIPGFGLDQIFGAKERVIRPVDNAHITVEPGSGLATLSSKETVNSEAFEEELEPSNGARVLGRFEDHEPAIVENLSGKGRGILIGSFLALAYHNEANETTRQVLIALARSAGVAPDVEVTGPGTSAVEVQRLVNTHEQVVFAFNHSDAQVNATLSLSLPFEARRMQNFKDDSSVLFSATGSRVTLRKAFSAGESWVVSIEGQHTE